MKIVKGFPKTRDDYYDRTLLCPSCGGDCTHIDNVEMSGSCHQTLRLQAPAEDSEELPTLKVVPGVDVDTRRQAVVAVGYCEFCADAFAVVMNQHKGSTFVETRIGTWEEIGLGTDPRYQDA